MLAKKSMFSSILQLGVTLGNLIFGTLLASFYGMSEEMDAYVVVLNIITLITSLFAHLQSKAVIPVLASEKPDLRGDALATILKFNVIVFTIVSALLFVLSRHVSFLLAPGLSSEQLAISSNVMKVAALYLFLSNITSLGHAILEFHLRPFLSIILAALRVVMHIVFLILAHKSFGVFAVPLAHMSGLLLTLPILVLFFKSKGYSFNTKATLNNKWVKEYKILATPLLIGMILVWVIKFSETFLASFLDAGSLSTMNYTQRIVGNFEVLFTGVFIVYYPVLTRMGSSNDLQGHVKTYFEGYQYLFLVSLTLSVFIMINSIPIVSILFERGKFTVNDTKSVSKLLQCYAVMMFCAPMGSFMANFYYSRKRGDLATLFSIISSLLNVFLNFLFVRFWGVYGLAIAASISYLAGNIMQMVFMKQANQYYKLHWALWHAVRAICTVFPSALAISFLKNSHVVQVLHLSNVQYLLISCFLYFTIIGISMFVMRYPIFRKLRAKNYSLPEK